MKQLGEKERESAKVRDWEAKECWREGKGKEKMRRNGGRCLVFSERVILKLVVLFEA